MIRGTQEKPDAATEHLKGVAARPEEMLIRFAKLIYPNLSEEKLRELFLAAQDDDDTDMLMQDVVRRGLQGSLAKRAEKDSMKEGK